MNTARLDDVIQAVGPDFHGLSYRERLIVGAVLKRLSTPPADDVREALADSRKVRQRYAERGLKRGGWKEEVRPHGTFTDADAKEEAVALAYNEVTGADGDEWSPDRTLAALNALWDAAKGVRS